MAAIKDPKEHSVQVAPNSTYTVFNGTVATGINSATQFLLSISTLSSDRYRFTWTGTGAAPAFRTDRALSPNGNTYTWLVNSNQTVSLTSDLVGDFTAMLAGDTLFVPGTSTGDIPGPFNPLNEGDWLVISKNLTSTVLQLARPSGADFVGYGQVVLSTANTDLVAFSSTGVQAGQVVSISNGFSSSAQKTFVVDKVSSTWFEVISTSPLSVAEVAVPGVTGMSFYSEAKKFLKVEVDQESVVRLNGDTSNVNQTSPWVAGNPDQVAEFMKVGPVWSLVIVNKSDVPMNVLVISAS